MMCPLLYTLADDLLVRTGGRYQLTPRAAILLQELDLLLPRLEGLWRGQDFAPDDMQGRVRLAMTDFAATVVLPHLLSASARLAPALTIEIVPWHERSFDDLSAATVDLVFSPLAVPAPFHVEPLFEDSFVCLLG